MQGQPDRIEQFKADIAELKITDPSSSPRPAVDPAGHRRHGGRASCSASTPTRCPTAPTRQPGAPAARRDRARPSIGVVVAVAGGALYLKGALAGFLRFWLVRDLHERRAQTDRVVEQLGGGAASDDPSADQP